MKRTLSPEFRVNLKRLLQGFAEHCEISEHLTGRVEQPIYFHGFKFGSPVFTFEGRKVEGWPKRHLGLLGNNDRDSNVASDVVLQLIELAALRPEIAVGQSLRILPVSDPITLELGSEGPDLTEWEVLHFVNDRFRESARDGLIEIGTHAGDEFIIHGNADSALYQSLASNATVKRDLPSLPVISDLRVAEEGRWHLYLEVPRNWASAGDVLAVSRFLSRLLETAAHLACPNAVNRPS